MKLNTSKIELRIFLSMLLALNFCIAIAQQQIPERLQPIINTTAMMSEIAYDVKINDPDFAKYASYRAQLIAEGWKWSPSTSTASGLNYTTFERTIEGKKEVVIAFRGTEITKPNDVLTDIVQMFIPPQQYRDALEIAAKFVEQKDQNKNMSLSFTGHSLGGGLAQMASRYTGLKSYVFNSAGLTDLTENFTKNPYLGVFLDKIGLAKTYADYLLNRNEIQNLTSSTTVHVKNEWDYISPIGHQSGLQIVMKSSPTSGVLDHHSQTNLINDIAYNHLKTISNSVSHYQYKNPVTTIVNKFEDFKSYNSPKTLFVCSQSSLNKLSEMKGNSQNYAFKTSGDYNKDYQFMKQYNFQNIVYLKEDYLKLQHRNDVYPMPNNNFSISNPHQPPPPPPSMLSIESKIGGVMLSGIADVKQEDNKPSSPKSFSFIFNGNAPVLDLDEYKKFCTSLWAVYFDPVSPGISIDPIAMDTSVKVQMVRYIGNVINTDLGRVMREADYKMKKWAVGTEKPDIEGFKNVDQLMASSSVNYFGASRRFWFVPEEMQFTAGNNFLLFNGGRMTLKTEYIFLDDKSENAEPADIAFADFFTNNYSAIAAKYPIYQELFDYAKHVSLANYLKQNRIPLLWFLLANKNFVMTENSVGTVKQLTKGSKYFKGTTIFGGVDLKYPKGNYVYDNTAVNAINTAVANQVKQTNFGILSDSSHWTNEPVSFEYKNDTLTFLDEYSLTTGTDLLGNNFQTDLSLWYGNEPGLEIVRIANSNQESANEFGYGWQYLIPYQIDTLNGKTVNSGDYVLKKYFIVKNKITNQTDTLVFDNKLKYEYLGYVPVNSNTSEFIFLSPLTDGTFQLADKLGSTYSFNESGYMSEMVLGNQREEHYKYIDDGCDPKKYPDIPLGLSFGNTTIDTVGYRIIEKLNVIDYFKKSHQTFSVNLDRGILTYKPLNPDSCFYLDLKPLTDNTYLLTDKSGGKYYFNQSGCLTETFSGYEYKVKYDYFKKGIDKFEQSPFAITPLSNETVTLGEITLPKKLSLIDKINGQNLSFTISDTSDLIKYIPIDNNSTFTQIGFLTDGDFKAVDKKGEAILFDAGGKFKGVIPVDYKSNFLKSVKQGDYEAEFIYTMLSDNRPVVSKIKVYKSVEQKLVYTLEYSYDEFGNLFKANTLLSFNK